MSDLPLQPAWFHHPAWPECLVNNSGKGMNWLVEYSMDREVGGNFAWQWGYCQIKFCLIFVPDNKNFAAATVSMSNLLNLIYIAVEANPLKLILATFPGMWWLRIQYPHTVRFRVSKRIQMRNSMRVMSHRYSNMDSRISLYTKKTERTRIILTQVQI